MSIEGHLSGNYENPGQGQFSELEQKVVSALIQLRRSKKISQEQLAIKLNTKQSVISRIENGASMPSLAFIKRMAEALDTEVEVTFKARTTQEAFSSTGPISKSIEYMCSNCLYHWQSELDRFVIQCPQCHKRQGVKFSEYIETLNAFEDMQLEIKKSPPFRKLPPLKGLKRNTPKMLRLVLESAASTFPSPSLPFSLLFRLLEQSKRERAERKTKE